MAGLELVGGWVDAITAALHLESSTEYGLRLCLEEAAANVVMHGIPGSDGGGADFVMLRIEPKAETLCVTVEDRCGAFNPLDVPTPERPTSLEDTPIGGLGIHLMRQYVRSMSYERVGDINRLTVVIGR